MKILLAGSPAISVNAFEEVINNFNVVAIITQPDRKQGRGMKLTQTQVATLAEKYGIKIFKPEKISDIKEELRQLNFDLLLSFAYGQWIPTSILSMGKYKPLNIHGSLLPKYRGAAPIHYAILNGDREIGITLIEMISEMDAGDMYFKASVKIDDTTTTGDAFEIIDKLATNHIVGWLNKIKENKIRPIKQGDNFTLSPKIRKSFGMLTPNLSSKEIIRKIRGLNPYPGAFIVNSDGKRIKVFDVSKENKSNSIKVKCSDAPLYAIEFQREGKKKVKI